MKNTPLILLLACLLGSNLIFAQKSMVSVGPGTLTASELNAIGPVLDFESILKNKTAIGFSAGYLLSNSAHDRPGRWRLLERVLVLQPGIKWYSKDAFQGFYLGAHGSYNRYSHTLKESRTGEKVYDIVKDINDAFVGFGADAGFSTAVGERFVFGIGLTTDLYVNYSYYEEGSLGLGFNAHFGYRF